MKKQKLLKLIQTTATLMCCALLIIGDGSLIPNPDAENNTPSIEIENLTPEDNDEEHHIPQNDDYPFDDEND